MKKINLAFLSAVVLFTTACSFELPQKISVRSNAEYNFGVGKINKDIGEYVKVNDLIKNGSLDSINGKVYDYFPDEADADTQRFLIKIPFIEVPIDIGKYYDESALSAAIQDVSFEKSIQIPDVSFSQNVELGDLSNISDTLNKLVFFDGTVTNSDVFDVTLNPSAAFSGCNFDSIVYNNCTFKIDNIIGITSGTRITISSNGKSFSGTVSGTTATIVINEPFEITKNSMQVSFDSVISNGGFSGSITSGEINTIRGLTLPDPLPAPLTLTINPVSADIDIPSGSFESCEIDTGNLAVKVNMPASWSGVTLSKSLEATGTALTIAKTTAETINLADETLKSGKTTIKVDDIKFGFTNATIKFADKPKISAGAKITKFNKIVLDASGINTGLQQKDEFPESVYSTVEQIVLAPSGIKGTYINTFPAGNDIKINVDSDFFGLSGKSATLSSNTKVQTAFSDILCADDRTVKFAKTNDSANNQFKEWDIDLKIDLPGSAAGKIEISGVKPNETYKIGVTITPVLDWKTVKIKADAFSGTPISGKQSLGFNIASLLKDAETQCKITGLSSEIGFVNLPIYIRAEKPAVANNLLDGFNFNGKVTLYQSADRGATSVSIGATSTPVEVDVVNGPINLVDALPDLKMKGDTLVTNISSYSSSVTADLANFFNQVLQVPETPTSELYVSYDVTMGTAPGATTIPINKEDISSGNTTSTLSAYALIEIPLKLTTLDNDIEVDVLDLAELNNDDLFKRESASSFDQITKYLDLMESCTVSYNPTKLPLIATKDPEVRIKLFPTSKEKVLTTRGGELYITHDEVQKMFETYPYKMESAKAVLPSRSVISIPRNLEFSAALSVKLVTNGEIDLMGGEN